MTDTDIETTIANKVIEVCNYLCSTGIPPRLIANAALSGIAAFTAWAYYANSVDEEFSTEALKALFEKEMLSFLKKNYPFALPENVGGTVH